MDASSVRGGAVGADPLRELPEFQVHLGGHVVRQAAQHALQLAGFADAAQQPGGQAEHRQADQRAGQRRRCQRRRIAIQGLRPRGRGARPGATSAVQRSAGRAVSSPIRASRRCAAAGLISACAAYTGIL